MPWVGFEPTIPAFELAKTVHALESMAAVIGYASVLPVENSVGNFFHVVDHFFCFK
jgi:hypothetical protein